MTPDHWKKVKHVFEQVRERPAEQRSAALGELCTDDSGLRREVQSLLAFHDRAGRFIEPGTLATSLPEFEPSPLVTGQLGPFRVVRLIGQGGMGTVYEAEQDSPRRRVALKVIRSGPRLDAHAARLYEREIQALARLSHPNIAAIYSAGRTDDGRRYFVMELVEGVSLDAYFRREDPARAARLELFATICDAIAYAHQRGVIHRDLKPGNILVTAKGTEGPTDSGTKEKAAWESPSVPWSLDPSVPTPKILDFGLARITESDVTLATTMTEIGRIQGTLAYMSPEQARGQSDAIDLRSDIYSLGVVLYEVLTGQLPYDIRGAAIPQAVRMVCEQAPLRPSAVLPALRGDLETIVLKAIEKEPSQRYQSAGELAADVRRFLRNEPILARPPSLAYQLRKIVARHRAISAMAAVLALSLLIFAVTMAVQSVRLTFQRDAATRSAQEARESLWESHLAEARALRASDQPGRRFAALEAVQKAAAIRRNLDVRNEALACLGLFDFRRSRTLARDIIRGVVDVNFEYAAAVDQQRNVHVFQVADGLEVARLDVRFDDHPFIFSPDGRLLLTATNEPGGATLVVRAWNWRENQCEWQIPNSIRGASLGASADFSPDSQRVVVALADHTVRAYDLGSGAEALKVSDPDERAVVRFSPDGARLAIGHDANRVIRILDSWTGEPAGLLELETPAGSFAWRPDGREIAVTCGETIHLVDAASGRATHSFHEPSYTSSLRWSRDGRFLITESWGVTGLIWDTADWRLVARLPAAGLSISPDNRAASVCEFSGGRANLEIIELTNDPGIFKVSVGSERSGATPAFLCDLPLVLWPDRDPQTGINGLSVIQPCAGTRLASLPIGLVRGLACSPQGNFFITSGIAGLLQWPVRRVADTVQIGPPRALWNKPDLGAVSVSADGRTLAVLHGWGTPPVYVLDPDEPANRRRFDCHGGPGVPLISASGRWLAVPNYNTRNTQIWDVRRGELAQTLAGAWSTSVSMSADECWLIQSEAGSTSLWNMRDWTQRSEFRDDDHPPVAVDSCFSPDGRLAAVHFGKNGVRLFRTDTWDELGTLWPSDLRGSIDGLDFNAAGTVLMAVTDRTDTLQIWDLRRIRSELAELGLDWNIDPFTATQETESVAASLRVVVDLGDLTPAAPTLDSIRRLMASRAPLPATSTSSELSDTAWNVVKTPAGAPEAYLAAMRLAEAAVRAGPQDESALNTLGVAQYRAARYVDALRTLSECDRIHRVKYPGDTPGYAGDVAFIAMCHSHLKHPVEARQAFERLQKMMTGDSLWSGDAECRAFVAESEACVREMRDN